MTSVLTQGILAAVAGLIIGGLIALTLMYLCAPKQGTVQKCNAASAVSRRDNRDLFINKTGEENATLLKEDFNVVDARAHRTSPDAKSIPESFVAHPATFIANLLHHSPHDSKDPNALVLTFLLPDHTTKTISFAGRSPPIGLEFGASGDTKACVGGTAKELGVQDGWKVEYVNEKHAGVMSIDQVKGLIKQQLLAQGKAQPGLLLGFLLPDGSSKTIDFGPKKIGLGVAFSRGRPCTITNVTAGGVGAALGVQEGWALFYINGQHVGGNTDPEDPVDKVKRRLAEM